MTTFSDYYLPKVNAALMVIANRSLTEDEKEQIKVLHGDGWHPTRTACRLAGISESEGLKKIQLSKIGDQTKEEE